MQDRTFDRLSRTFAEQSTRRGLLGGVGALIAAGVASTAFGQKRSFGRQFAAAADDSEEQAVLLFEELGRIAHEHDGTCDDMAGKVYAFQDQYGDDILRFQAEQAAWPDDRRARHADTYGERRLVVVDRINAVHERCQAMDASGTPGSPVATPIVAALATPAASPVAVDKGHPTVRRAFAQGTPKCDQSNYNFKPEAFCEKDGWKSPPFQWPAHCPSGTITQTCELCLDDFNGVTLGWMCPKYWPQDCAAADGTNLCQVNINSGGGGVAGANCDQVHATATPQAKCYKRNSDWESPAFAWPALCPDVRIDHECILCTEDPGGDVNPDMCVKYWPQDCNSSSEGNVCYIGWNVPEGTSCCEQNCPISTADCALNGIGSFIGDYRCAGCMTSWCGSTDRCLEDCKINDCCNGACSETTKSGLPFDGDDDDDDTTDFPGGEGRRGGTPIPIGTPATEAPTEAPATEVPTEMPTPPIATPLT